MGKRCPDCGQPLTQYRDDGAHCLSSYSAGDLIGRCDNPQCVAEGSTWRIRRAKAQELPCVSCGKPQPVRYGYSGAVWCVECYNEQLGGTTG